MKYISILICRITKKVRCEIFEQTTLGKIGNVSDPRTDNKNWQVGITEN